jgi:hypothetical protein
VYKTASDGARSGFGALVGECQRLVELGAIAAERDQSPESMTTRALSACDAAATVRPDDPAPIVQQARAWHLLASYQMDHGTNPTAAFEEALRLGNRALAIDANDASAHQMLGQGSLGLALQRLKHGGDPRELLEQAIAHASQARTLNRGFSDLLTARAYGARGAYEGMRGIDPRPSYAAEIASARRAVEVFPAGYNSWNLLGMALLDLAGWKAAHSADPIPDFVGATDAFAKVNQLSPSLDHGHINLCAAYQTWASFELKVGRDPRPRVEAAIASCERAIGLDANYDGSHFYLAWTSIDLAAWQLDHGGNPTAAIKRARAELQRSLEIDRDDPQALMVFGSLATVEGRWLAASGRDPELAFRAGEVDARKSLSLSDENQSMVLGVLTELYRRRSEYRAQHGLAVSAVVREGLALGERAIEQDREQGDAMISVAALHLVAARAASQPVAVASEVAAARAAYEKALAIDSNLRHAVVPLQNEVARLTH